MFRSFLVVAVTFIFMLLTIPYIHSAKESLQGTSASLLTILFTLKFFIGLVLTLGFVYFFCKIVKRKHNFIKYIAVSNWCSIIPLVLFIPLLILLKLGMSTYNDVYPLIIVISVYSYALAAFIVRYVIDIPWELAVFVTVCILAINEGSFDLLYYIAS